MYLALKHSHLTLLLISVLLFNYRYFASVWRGKTLPRWLKIAPHLIDTLLFASGVGLAVYTHQIPFANAQWLGIKLVLLPVYVFVGAQAMRAKPRSAWALYLYLLAMAVVAVMAALARMKPVLW